MAEDGQTCSYTHELDSGTWHCPHEVVVGVAGSEAGVDGDGSSLPGDRCVFHAPVEQRPAGAAARALRDLANREGKRCKEFVGARFGDLNLAFARVDAPDNHPVSLLDARIEGDLRLTSGEVTQPLVIDGVTVEGEAVCENTTFGAEVGAADATFRGGVDFQGEEFQERLRLENAAFEGPANFHAVEFDETADFEWTDFAAPADFARTDFAGDAVFTGARFAGSAGFDAAQVGGKGDFRAVRFGDRVSFHDARFEGSVTFGVPSDADRSTVEVQYHGGARPTESVFEFEGVLEHVRRRQADPGEDRVVGDDRPHFDGETDFGDAEFLEEVRFAGVTVRDSLSMRDVRFHDPVTFRRPGPHTGPESGSGPAVIDLRDGRIPAGTLGQAEEGTVVYDLAGATLGDVRVEGGRGTPFEHCRFLHTTFDGFDFGKYRDSVAAADWRIHTTFADLDRPDPSRGDLEATYLKAKNGASAVGDRKASAEFFRQELRYRRQGYAARLLGDGGNEGGDLGRGRRLLAGTRWAANALLDASSGYGARPSRVILFSLAIVVAFAPLFRLLRPTPPYPDLPVLGYLLISFESFATGMRTGGPTLTDPTVRFVSEAETFVGAFMIGLFVFTLTRSINR